MTFRKTTWWYRDDILFMGRKHSPAELFGTFVWPTVIIGLLFLL